MLASKTDFERKPMTRPETSSGIGSQVRFVTGSAPLAGFLASYATGSAGLGPTLEADSTANSAAGSA